MSRARASVLVMCLAAGGAAAQAPVAAEPVMASDPAGEVRDARDAVVAVAIPKGAPDRIASAPGCVVLATAPHPRAALRRAFFSRLCAGASAGSFVEERGVVDGRAGQARFRRRVVPSTLLRSAPSAQPLFVNGESERAFETRLLRLVRARSEVEAALDHETSAPFFALLRRDVVARAVTLSSLSWPGAAKSAEEWPSVEGVSDAYFEQGFRIAAWLDVAPIAWSRSGAVFSVSRWPWGDWEPPVGYAAPTSALIAFDTLAHTLKDDGAFHVVGFDGEDAVVSVLGERACAPTTWEQLLDGGGCAAVDAGPSAAEPPPRGVYERWEGVVDVTGPLPVLKRAIGPFLFDEACGESGPAGVRARMRSTSGECAEGAR